MRGNPRHLMIACAAGALLLTGCGGDDDAAAPPAGAPPASNLVTMTEYYPNGSKKAEGTVQAEEGSPILDGSGQPIREGGWMMWFSNGNVQWTGSYDDGAVDDTRPWREYNRDGSVRDDWQDL